MSRPGHLTRRPTPACVLLGLGVVASAGCPPVPDELADASSRRDVTAVEVGLVFEDARPGDARPLADAAPSCLGCSPGAGCACVLTGRAAECSSVPGSASEGDPCDYPRDCGAGLACFISDGRGVCAPFCCPGAASCAAGSTCRGPASLVDGTTTSWGRCVRDSPCGPFEEPTPCGEGESCAIVDAEGGAACRPLGVRGTGEPCMTSVECVSRHACVGSTSPTCVPLCRVGGSDCSRTTACVRQAYTPEGVGVCISAS